MHLLFVLLLGAGLVYKYIIAGNIPAALNQEIAGQAIPFTIPKDNERVEWRRALQLLKGRKHLLSGGKLVQTDSTLLLPCYSDNHKGNSIRIERQ